MATIYYDANVLKTIAKNKVSKSRNEVETIENLMRRLCAYANDRNTQLLLVFELRADRMFIRWRKDFKFINLKDLNEIFASMPPEQRAFYEDLRTQVEFLNEESALALRSERFSAKFLKRQGIDVGDAGLPKKRAILKGVQA